MNFNNPSSKSTKGTFAPHGHHDILNTALGRVEHPGRVRVAGHGVTIGQFFGQHASGSHNSAASITPNQLVEIIGILKQEWRREVEDENKKTLDIMKKELDAIKSELSQMQTQQLAPVRPPNADALIERVSTKESCAEAAANVAVGDPFAADVTNMGLYIVCSNNIQLVASGKVYGQGGTIHNVPYVDDVVRVYVETIYDGDVKVPFPTSEIQYVKEASNIFIGWPTHLVKPISLM